MVDDLHHFQPGLLDFLEHAPVPQPMAATEASWCSGTYLPENVPSRPSAAGQGRRARRLRN